MISLNYSNTSVTQILLNAHVISVIQGTPSCLHQPGFSPNSISGSQRHCHQHSLCYSNPSTVEEPTFSTRLESIRRVPRSITPCSHGMQEHNLGDGCSHSLRVTPHSNPPRVLHAATPVPREEQNTTQSNWRSIPPIHFSSDSLSGGRMHSTAGTTTSKRLKCKINEADRNPHEFAATIATAFYYQEGKETKAKGTYRYFYCSPFIQQHTFSHFLSQLDNVYVHKKPSKKHYVAFSKEKNRKH